MRILYIAYPLLPVSDASAGGAEQMLWTLEREMHRRGHETTVAACAGSSVSGRLFSTGELPKASDTFERRDREHQHAIRNLLQCNEFDVIHDKSGTFFKNAANIPFTMLATLHLPRTFYGEANWHDLGRMMAVNCVSASQAHTFVDVPALRGWVPNGIALERFPLRSAKEDFLLWMGRICEEKAPHLAIEVARKAKRRLVLAGQVYPFRYHEEYFEREVKPHLGGDVVWIESPSFEKKVDLLGRATALLVTSQAEETSSLVAMEAAACGTPVIAFRRGALPEIVAQGKTGFLVDTPEEMAESIGTFGEISPAQCRRYAERNFSAARMTDAYEKLYRALAGQRVGEAA